MSNLINRLIENLEDLYSQRLSPGNKEDEKLFEETGENLNDLLLLGENARKMLEIGILQDELMKLGFEKYSLTLSGMGKFRFTNEKLYISVRFYIDFFTIDDDDFYYSSPTWQQDALTKIKELIKCGT